MRKIEIVKKIDFVEYVRLNMIVFLSLGIVFGIVFFVFYFFVQKGVYIQVIPENFSYFEIKKFDIAKILLFSFVYFPFAFMLTGMFVGILSYPISNLFIKVLKIKVEVKPTRKDELDEIFRG